MVNKETDKIKYIIIDSLSGFPVTLTAKILNYTVICYVVKSLHHFPQNSLYDGLQRSYDIFSYGRININ